MKPTAEQERVFTAYHEAGHLAAALVFRTMPRGATIRPGDGYFGLAVSADRTGAANGHHVEHWAADLEHLGTQARAVEMMAGFAAEERAGHPDPESYANRDRLKAYALLLHRFEHREVAARELERATALARAMMQRAEVWSAVGMLADGLLEHETLSGARWRDIALRAARCIHGRDLDDVELARWVGWDVVAADSRAVTVASAPGRAVWWELVKAVAPGVVVLGLLFCALLPLQLAEEARDRKQYEDKLRTVLEKRAATPATLPPALAYRMQQSLLLDRLKYQKMLLPPVD